MSFFLSAGGPPGQSTKTVEKCSFWCLTRLDEHNEIFEQRYAFALARSRFRFKSRRSNGVAVIMLLFVLYWVWIVITHFTCELSLGHRISVFDVLVNLLFLWSLSVLCPIKSSMIIIAAY